MDELATLLKLEQQPPSETTPLMQTGVSSRAMAVETSEGKPAAQHSKSTTPSAEQTLENTSARARPEADDFYTKQPRNNKKEVEDYNE
ncbi:hypothetical protein PI125_g16372 [Phytophthora idaei]|nr:hypothetical protein PI125_g16372 [Phytophthora idaei]KAG3152826.1 hypothetical protein PI126_g10333 [Phytophthora idaei]